MRGKDQSRQQRPVAEIEIRRQQDTVSLSNHIWEFFNGLSGFDPYVYDPSYTGQTYDIETGLYYYKARYYNPKLARFIQPDTIVPDAKNLQAYNKYSYVINNPLKYIDPIGHFFWLIGLVAIGIALSNIAALIGVNFILAAMITGMVTGVITGAISGGWKGALLGGLFGAIQGVAFGGINIRLGQTIMTGVSASLSYATGGWKGLRNFGIAIFASYALNRLAGAAMALFSRRGQNEQLPAGQGGPDEEDKAKLQAIISENSDKASSDDPKNYFVAGRGFLIIGGASVGVGYNSDPGLPLYRRPFFFVQGEYGGGIEGSLSAEAGFVNGSVTDYAYNVNVSSPLRVGGSLIIDPSTDIPIGGTMSLGTGLPIGLSGSRSIGVQQPIFWWVGTWANILGGR